MSVTRVHEDPARHQAVQRRAVGGDRRARPRSRRAISREHDVRLTQGGEPTFVSIDDMDGAGVELHRAVAEEARARRNAAAPPRATLRARRLPAHRAGQVVPGRAAAALGARRLLAHRRQAAVARRRADRRHAHAGHVPTSRPRSASRTALAARLGLDPAFVSRRTRTCRSCSAPNRRCRSMSIRCTPISSKPDRARAPRAAAAAGPRSPGRLRAAAARRATASDGGAAEWHSEPVAAAPRAAVRACRAIRRSACACRCVAAGRAARGRRAGARGRPVRAARRAAATRAPVRAARAEARRRRGRSRRRTSIKTALVRRGARRATCTCSCRR